MKKMLLATAALMIAATPAASLAADADAAIKYRKNLMKIVGGTAGTIGAVLKGEAGQKSDLASLTKILAAVSNPAITGPAFNQNTDGQGSEKTTAIAKIWADWDDFAGIAVKFNQAAQAAADKGDAVTGADLKPVFAQCKACHDGYRKK